MTKTTVTITDAKTAQKLIDLQILSPEDDALLTEKFDLPKPLGVFRFQLRPQIDYLPRDAYGIGLEDYDLENQTILDCLKEQYCSSQSFAEDMLMDVSLDFDVYLNGELIE